LRDFFIDRFGLEDADKALPAWQIDWLEQSDDPAPRFAAAAAPQPETQKETALDKTPAPVPNPAPIPPLPCARRR